MQQLLDRFVFRIGPTTVAFVKSTDDDRLWCAHTMRQSSFRRLCVQQKTKIAWCVPGFRGWALFGTGTLLCRVQAGRTESRPKHQFGYTTSFTTSFISNIEHNNITPTICSQHWDGWKGGGQKNILIVVHPQHQLISIVIVK